MENSLKQEKENAYQELLGHLRLGMQKSKSFVDGKPNMEAFSRLGKIEWAMKALSLSINYKCLENGVDGSTIFPKLQIFEHRMVDMPNGEKYDETNAGETHNYFDKDGNLTTDVSLGLSMILKAFNSDPIRIMRCALHEVGHAVESRKEDYSLTKIDLRDNLPVKEMRFSPQADKMLWESYQNKGIAWLGNEREYSANAQSFSTMTSLLKDLSMEEHPVVSQDYAKIQIEWMEKKLKEQSDAQIKLQAWKKELEEQSKSFFASRGSEVGNNVPNNRGNEDITIEEYRRNNFVSEEAVLKASQDNPELMTTSNYTESLQGASCKQEVVARGLSEEAEKFVKDNSQAEIQIALAQKEFEAEMQLRAQQEKVSNDEVSSRNVGDDGAQP